MGQAVSYERDGAVGTIVVDDGKVNAMSVSTMMEINDALDQAQEDRTVVVLSGREGLFSAGFDLAVFKQGPGPLGKMLRTGGELNARILSFPRPIVAACTGHAIAMGSFLLMSSDYRIGADGPFRLGMNEVAIGMTLPYFAVEIARQRVPVRMLSRAVLLAEMFAPKDAVEAGFLDMVVAPENVLAVAQERARAMSELDLAAHAATKTRIRDEVAAAVRRATETEFAGE